MRHRACGMRQRRRCRSDPPLHPAPVFPEAQAAAAFFFSHLMPHAACRMRLFFTIRHWATQSPLCAPAPLRETRISSCIGRRSRPLCAPAPLRETRIAFQLLIRPAGRPPSGLSLRSSLCRSAPLIRPAGRPPSGLSLRSSLCRSAPFNIQNPPFQIGRRSRPSALHAHRDPQP